MSSPNRRTPYDPFSSTPAAAAARQQFMPEGWMPTAAQVEEFDRTGTLPPPGQRFGTTGGLLPNQGQPQEAAPDLYAVGSADRLAAEQYYSGATGRPRPSEVPGVSASPRPTAAVVPSNPFLDENGTMQLGERDPEARKPGAGQGTIRRGDKVYAYNRGSPLRNAGGSKRTFGNEDEAMNELDKLRANPLANAGDVTMAARRVAAPQPAAETVAAMEPAAPVAAPAPVPEAQPVMTPAGARLPTPEEVQAAAGGPAPFAAEMSLANPLSEETRARAARLMAPTPAAPARRVTPGSTAFGTPSILQWPGMAIEAARRFVGAPQSPAPVESRPSMFQTWLRGRNQPSAPAPAVAQRPSTMPGFDWPGMPDAPTPAAGAPPYSFGTSLSERPTPRKNRAYQVVAERFNPFGSTPRRVPTS